jgi:hypothetical protein
MKTSKSLPTKKSLAAGHLRAPSQPTESAHRGGAHLLGRGSHVARFRLVFVLAALSLVPLAGIIGQGRSLQKPYHEGTKITKITTFTNQNPSEFLRSSRRALRVLRGLRDFVMEVSAVCKSIRECCEH